MMKLQFRETGLPSFTKLVTQVFKMNCQPFSLDPYELICKKNYFSDLIFSLVVICKTNISGLWAEIAILENWFDQFCKISLQPFI